MKIERNAPCPCNSGKKYKKCCLITAYQKEQQEHQIFLQWLEQDLAVGKNNIEELNKSLTSNKI